MRFTDPLFLFAFLPVVVAAYRLLARVAPGLPPVLLLLAASALFYLLGESAHPWLLAASALFNLLVARRIARAGEGARRRWLTGGIAVDLLLLALFKYGGVTSDALAAAGLSPAAGWHPALPVGISFYTFTQIAFLADVAAARVAVPDGARHGLFVAYFPHLVAGPILHAREMLPQFGRAPFRPLARDLHPGLAMLAIGLAKKLLLADPCGTVADEVFASAAPGLAIAWTGAVAYALQIYFDFSGYSDMAIGMSRMLGIALPINFNAPYRAASPIDFWRRWHITLSRFLRDYLYVPLGGSRRGKARRMANLFATMLLGGLWHGAGWTFVLWGALHGAALAVAHGWRATGRRLPRGLGWALTTLFVVAAWVPFRAADLGAAAALWRGLAGLNGLGLPDLGPLGDAARRLGLPVVATGFRPPALAAMLLAGLVALVAPTSQQWLHRFRVGLDTPGYEARGPRTRWALGMGWRSAASVGVLLGLALRAVGPDGAFLYFRF